MSETNSAAEAAQPVGADDENTRQNLAKIAAIWQHAGPVIQPVANAAISALENHGRNTGRITGGLLALIIVCLSGLAWMAMDLGHVDTAEKVIIAMVSFLGGAAMFSGTPKK